MISRIVLGRVLQQAARAPRTTTREIQPVQYDSIISEKSMPSEGQTHINETWPQRPPGAINGAMRALDSTSGDSVARHPEPVIFRGVCAERLSHLFLSLILVLG